MEIKQIKKHVNTESIFDERKEIPQAPEYEVEVIGACMVLKDQISLIANILKPEHFYNDKHQIVYSIILDLYKKNEPVDTLSVVQKLRDIDKLDYTGGPAYISTLSRKASFIPSIVYRALILIQKFILRDIITMSGYIKNLSYDNTDIFEVIEYINNKLVDYSSFSNALRKQNLSKKVEDTIDNIIKIHTNEELITSTWYPFGIPDLDKIPLVAPNHTLLVGGKSGAGKSRFIIYLMRNLLNTHGNNVSIKWYSMEDDSSKLMRCLLSPYVALTDEQLEGKNYKLDETDINKLISMKTKFSNYDVEIIESPRSMSEINIETKSFISERTDKMNILIIDNLMLLNDHKSKDNQNKIDDAIARELYDIRNSAQNNNIKLYTIVLHHFTDEQLDKLNIKTAYRPTEKHLKGSTRLRDASTQILLLNRLSNYPDLIESFPSDKEILQKLMIAELTKNRNGSTGITRWFTQMEYTNFEYINSTIN